MSIQRTYIRIPGPTRSSLTHASNALTLGQACHWKDPLGQVSPLDPGQVLLQCTKVCVSNQFDQRSARRGLFHSLPQRPFGCVCRPERSEQARMLGFASLGCVTRRDKPTSRDGDGGSLRLGPCQLGTAGPAGQQHFRIDKFGPQGQQKILKCCHAGPAPPVQQINQVC